MRNESLHTKKASRCGGDAQTAIFLPAIYSCRSLLLTGSYDFRFYSPEVRRDRRVRAKTSYCGMCGRVVTNARDARR